MLCYPLLLFNLVFSQNQDSLKCANVSSTNLDKLNTILPIFNFIFAAFNPQLVDLTQSLVFFIDDSPFSTKEGLYIRTQTVSVPNVQYYELIIYPKSSNDYPMITSVFCVNSNIKTGITVDTTQGTSAFVLRIEPSVDLSKLVLMISKLGLVTTQESVPVNFSDVGLKFYSDIFSVSPVEYTLTGVPGFISNDYEIASNEERAIASIYKALQNLTYHCGVSSDRLERMRNAIVQESFREKIKEYFRFTGRIDNFNELFEKYTCSLKSVIKAIAFSYEKNEVPPILLETNKMIRNRLKALNRLVGISYRRSELENRQLELEIEQLF